MPRVSVIIPAYNRAGFLPDSVGSVLAQTCRDFEVILIDDGSTDNTPEIVKGFPPVVRYYRQENGGISSARNLGVRHARGEYIAFLDSDDTLLENALEKSVACLDRYPEAGFCYGKVYYMDEKGDVMWWRKSRGDKESCLRDGREQIERLIFRGEVQVTGLMARRRCLEEVGLFDTSRIFGEDIDMWLRLCKKFPVGYIAEPLGTYRIHSQSVTENKKLEDLVTTQTEFIEQALRGLEPGPSFRHLRRKAYFGLYCYIAEENARSGHRARALNFALRAVRAYPALLFHKDGALFMFTVARSFLPRWVRRSARRLLLKFKLR